MRSVTRQALLVGALVFAATAAWAADYSWQESHAKVLPTGNFEWTPKPFVFEKGASVRYIDFEAGDDAKDGTTQQTAWKHHPWDPAATGAAKECKGIQTYVFKAGVAYRLSGPLKALESGEPGNPIRLTCDPTWGQGDAFLIGSTMIRGGWKKADANEAPGMPEPDKIWYIDLGKDYDPDRTAAEQNYSAKFSSMWQVADAKGEKVERLHIARQPNYDLSDPDNPVKNWPVWTGFQKDGNSNSKGTFTAPELKGLGDANALNGAVIWTETSFLMAAIHKVSPKNYNPDAGSVYFGDGGGVQYQRIPSAKVHFMIENVAKFLDSPGEYYFAIDGPKAGRLFLRAPGDADPNTMAYEVAQVRFPIWIADQHDIVVSGLRFQFTDPDDGLYAYPAVIRASGAVRVVGNCRNITVKNCKFYYVAGAVTAFPRPEVSNPPSGPYGVYSKEIGAFADDVMDNITICDNDVMHAEKSHAIYASGGGMRGKDAPYGKLLRVDVLRNRVVDAGFRADAGANSSIPAISVEDPETCEIAGNVVDTSYGNGIFTHGGKGSGSTVNVPLTRMLVHDNMIDNTMLGCNDYGGLEHFQGGPIYIYNNITRNCVGNRALGRELGYSLYLDGAFKVYTFNNIIAGKYKPEDPNYYNHCGYFMVFGFMNQFCNNTIDHFQMAVDGSSGNRSNVLGNLMLNCSESFLRQNRPGDVSMMGGGDTGAMGAQGIPTMAYASNVFFGSPKGTEQGNKKQDAFGDIAGTSNNAGGGAPTYKGNTLEELSKALADMKCRLSSVGIVAPAQPIADPGKRDYRPTADSAAKGMGVKYFVPWALARNVGEWNFYKSASTPQIVLGEGYYMTDEYIERGMYYNIPRNDLAVSQCAAADYVAGDLEDWIEGALAFDGKRVASISQAELTKNMQYPNGRNQSPIQYDGSKRETVDMGTNNFLIEAVLKTSGSAGSVAAKGAQAGYELAVGADGAPQLTLMTGGAKAVVKSTAKVNDGKWHHVLAEVDRAAGKAAIYVDGKPAGDGKLDAIAKDASLANADDFVVGKGLTGAVDFLRVCRSTLAESKTTIGELYAWEFDGPQLRDFLGNKPAAKRDAGAVGMAK